MCRLTLTALTCAICQWIFWSSYASAAAPTRTACVIPNETLPGHCKAIGQCPAYLRIRNVTQMPAERVNFLRQVQCQPSPSPKQPTAEPHAIPFDESTHPADAPLICCPQSEREYAQPWVRFTAKVDRRATGNCCNAAKKKRQRKLKRRIQTVESLEGFGGGTGVGAICCKQVTNRIYGGEIAELDEYPWLALLVYNSNEFGCSGSLIDDRHVLTAAHCLQGESVRQKLGLRAVRLGEFNVKTEPDCIEEPNFLSCADSALDVPPERIYLHPDYRESLADKYNDIGVIRLLRAVSFTHFIMPICLPQLGAGGLARAAPAPDQFEAGQMFSVSGWGRTDLFNKYFVNIHSPIKLKLRIPYVPRANCSQLLQQFGITLGERQICAGGEYDKDTCAGDSGGPLMHFDRQRSSWVAAGVVSFGFTKCGIVGHPAVYTEVRPYVDWIRSVMEAAPPSDKTTTRPVASSAAATTPVTTMTTAPGRTTTEPDTTTTTPAATTTTPDRKTTMPTTTAATTTLTNKRRKRQVLGRRSLAAVKS